MLRGGSVVVLTKNWKIGGLAAMFNAIAGEYSRKSLSWFADN